MWQSQRRILRNPSKPPPTSPAKLFSFDELSSLRRFKAFVARVHWNLFIWCFYSPSSHHFRNVVGAKVSASRKTKKRINLLEQLFTLYKRRNSQHSFHISLQPGSHAFSFAERQSQDLINVQALDVREFKRYSKPASFANGDRGMEMARQEHKEAFMRSF